MLRRVFSLWGTPQIDLFASAVNAQLPLYCSRTPDAQAVCQDALSMDWTGWEVYCFPPFALLLRVLDKIRREQVNAVVIAPHWPRRPWFSLLVELSADVPRLLPLQRDLLSQSLAEKGTVLHPDLKSLHLVAWRLSGCDSVLRAFRSRLLTSPPKPCGSLPERSMTRAGTLTRLGAGPGIPLPLQPL